MISDEVGQVGEGSKRQIMISHRTSVKKEGKLFILINYLIYILFVKKSFAAK